MTLSIVPSSIPYREGVEINSYEVQDGKQIAAEPIQQIGYIETGKIDKGRTHAVDFSRIGIPLTLESLFVHVGDERLERLNLMLDRRVDNKWEELLTIPLNRGQIPYKFELNLVLPINRLRIHAPNGVANCFIFAKPCYPIFDAVANRVTDNTDDNLRDDGTNT